MNKTGIEWTNESWNPVTGCTKVSAGCKNCYAERDWPRLSAPGQPYEGRRFTDIALHPERLKLPNWRKLRMVFVNSMSDLFHPQVSDAFIEDVLHAIGTRPGHVFQILTKRPERLHDFRYPDNAWVGVSVEDQEQAGARIPYLIDTTARVRFLSCEPLLAPVDLGAWLEHLDWVIVGGESGSRARARLMREEWAATILADCRSAMVPFFMKQMTRKAPIPDALMVREWPRYPADTPVGASGSASIRSQ